MKYPWLVAIAILPSVGAADSADAMTVNCNNDGFGSRSRHEAISESISQAQAGLSYRTAQSLS
jgi:hypothetical protein